MLRVPYRTAINYWIRPNLIDHTYILKVRLECITYFNASWRARHQGVDTPKVLVILNSRLERPRFYPDSPHPWIHQSFGKSYKTSRLGSPFPSCPPHHGTLPLIYFACILLFIWLIYIYIYIYIHIISFFIYWKSGRVLYYVQVIHTIHTYIVYRYPVRVPISSYINYLHPVQSSSIWALDLHIDTTIQKLGKWTKRLKIRWYHQQWCIQYDRLCIRKIGR